MNPSGRGDVRHRLKSLLATDRHLKKWFPQLRDQLEIDFEGENQ